MPQRGEGNSLDVGHALTDGSVIQLSAAERARHLYVAGATGAGKSRFLESLIRQDITNWPTSRSGMLLLDPHGALYDGILQWLVDTGFTAKRPIIPIDLRDDDWVIGYNPLRQKPDVDPSLIVRDLVMAMAHVWGKADTNDTPRLHKWTTATLEALYEQDLTIAEAGHILFPAYARLRELLTKDLKNPTAAGVWRQVRRAEKLEEAAESTVNRFQTFLGTKAMRTIFGQTGGLDLTTALAEGQIILVSLATRNKVHAEDARLFGTLLLSDLWNTASRTRDKRSNPTPFYVYLDEFQKFVTPTIAENLDEARGFGLHFTMANQYPKQVIHEGGEEFGRHLYDSLFQNTGNTVAFRLTHPPEDVEAFARILFDRVLDPNQVKLRLTSPTVVGYHREMFSGTSESTAEAESTSDGESSSDAESTSEGAVFDPENPLEDIQSMRSVGGQAGSSRSSARTRQQSSSRSVTTREGLVPELQERTSSVQFRSLDEQRDIAIAAIGAQDDRHGTGRFVGRRDPIAFRSLDTADAVVSGSRLTRYREKLLLACGVALRVADAEAVLIERQAKLLQGLELEVSQTARKPLPRQ